MEGWKREGKEPGLWTLFLWKEIGGRGRMRCREDGWPEEVFWVCAGEEGTLSQGRGAGETKNAGKPDSPWGGSLLGLCCSERQRPLAQSVR